MKRSPLLLAWLAIAPAARAEPRCGADSPAARVDAELRKAYKPSVSDHATLVIQRSACAAEPAKKRLVFEFAGGHGNMNKLTELRFDDAGDVLVTRITILGYGGGDEAWKEARSAVVHVHRGRVPQAQLATALAFTWATLPVQLAEHIPKSPKGQSLGGFWGSSSDFFVRLALDDSAGASFAGYEASNTQFTYLPMRLAINKLRAALDGAQLPEVPIDAPARALFLDSWHKDAPHFDEKFHWWVRELYLQAAGVLGDPSLVPAVAKYLDGAGSDASLARSRIYALNTLAALLGKDLRRDSAGKERPLEDVVRDYRKLAGATP